MLLFAVGTALLLIATAAPLMRLLYGENSEGYAHVFRLLIICIVPISFTYVFGSLLTAAGELRTLNRMAAATIVLSLLLNLLLIPRYGAWGSACASVAAQGLMAAGQTVVACRHFHLPFGRLLIPRNPLLIMQEMKKQ